MSKDWWGDDDKCGECIYNKYDNREKCYVCVDGEVVEADE